MMDEKVVQAAMRAAVREGLLPRDVSQEDYLKRWTSMRAVLGAAFSAAGPPVCREEHGRLLSFAREVMATWPEGDLDGGELQEAAVRYGLLVGRVVHGPCGEACNCAHTCDARDFADGVRCFRYADWFRVPEAAVAGEGGR